TFGWPPERLAFLMAGGLDALTQAQEGAEDESDAGRAAIDAAQVTAADVVVGVAASGRTPYTLAAIERARGAGALTVGIANNAGTSLLTAAEHPICVETGSEVIAGSTRMKAGTAQKAVLNLLSTAIMVRLGLVYDGRMVAMRISNAKLLHRGREMVRDIAGVDDDAAARALAAADNDIRVGIVMARGLARDAACALLAAHRGNLRPVMQELDGRG
ncbi:N-acetylmuramic acid 6-phosphate etherase, partial [Sphingomonas adhaesiva]